MKRFVWLAAFLLGMAGFAAPAWADQTIATSGPLTTITIGSELNCAVNYVGDSAGEFYGDTACGTFVAANGVLYGPTNVPAGGSATGVPGYTPFTPVSQSAVAGAGTSASPYVITTVVALGSSGLTLTQVNSYVTGDEFYATSATLSLAAGLPAVNAIIYHAADCYLQDSDYGLGTIDNGNSPLCKAQSGATNPNRIEGFYPLTPGSNYIEDNYDTVWAAIGSMQPFPNSCQCEVDLDNGAGVSWNVTLSPAGQSTVSLLTVFSPTGATPVTFAKTADAATSEVSATNGYTITVSNAGTVPQTLSSITDTLPAGFTYIAGSSTGATTTDPAIAGAALTWSGTFVVPAATAGGPGTLALHFGVTVSAQAGTYTNSVTGAGTGVAVVEAINTAPITVTAVVVPVPVPPPTELAVVAQPMLAATGPGNPSGEIALALALLGLGGALVAAGRTRTAR